MHRGIWDGYGLPKHQSGIHYRASNTTEQYIQETGRSARDIAQSRALLIKQKSKYTSKEMTEYMKNSTRCHRQYLFQECLGVPHVITDTLCTYCSFCVEVQMQTLHRSKLHILICMHSVVNCMHDPCMYVALCIACGTCPLCTCLASK